MQPVIAIPVPIAFPADPCFSQAVIFVAVQFLRFVTAEKGLDVGLVFWALYPGIFQLYIQSPGCFTEAASRELRPPVYPEGQLVAIGYSPPKRLSTAFSSVSAASSER